MANTGYAISPLASLMVDTQKHTRHNREGKKQSVFLKLHHYGIYYTDTLVHETYMGLLQGARSASRRQLYTAATCFLPSHFLVLE